MQSWEQACSTAVHLAGLCLPEATWGQLVSPSCGDSSDSGAEENMPEHVHSKRLVELLPLLMS